MTDENAATALDIRRLQPSEMQQAIRLADSVFRDLDPAKKSFGISHPQLFAPSMSQSFGAFREGTLVSFIGLVPSVVRIGQARLNCFSIGGVCTHPDHRGMGYASQILDKVFEHADQSGGSVMLISGSRSLYTRVNCFAFGAFRLFKLNADIAAKILAQHYGDSVRVREMEAEDWFGLYRAAETRACAFEQSLWDLALLLNAEAAGSAAKHLHKVVVAEQEGIIKAFAVIGVPYPGTISAPMVYEWGGDPSLVSAVLSEAVRRYSLPELHVNLSWDETELSRKLEEASCEATPATNNGTIRIINPDRLISQLRPYLMQNDPEAGGELQAASTADGRVALHLFGRTAELDAESFVSLIFTPDPQVKMDQEMNDKLRAIFPVPFPYARGLNYV